MQKTNSDTQKIDNSLLKTPAILITTFQVLNKLGQSWFFLKTCLLYDISIQVIYGMAFLTFGNANV